MHEEQIHRQIDLRIFGEKTFEGVLIDADHGADRITGPQHQPLIQPADRRRRIRPDSSFPAIEHRTTIRDEPRNPLRWPDRTGLTFCMVTRTRIGSPNL